MKFATTQPSQNQMTLYKLSGSGELSCQLNVKFETAFSILFYNILLENETNISKYGWFMNHFEIIQLMVCKIEFLR